MPVTHPFVSAIPDSGDAALVQPSNWNDNHTVSIVNADVSAIAAIVESKLSLNFATHAALTIGTANGLSLVTQALSLGLASAGVTGALSGTDWSTFNNKQAALGFTPVDAASADWIDLTDGGATTLHSHAGGGSAPFIDSTAIIKGSVDDTKLWRVEVDGFTTGQTRVFTPPNADLTITGGGTIALGGFTLTVPATGTAALLATANVFTASQTITPGTDVVGLVINKSSTAKALQVKSGANVYGFITNLGKIGINPDAVYQDSELVDSMKVERFIVDLNTAGGTGKRALSVDLQFYSSVNSSADYVGAQYLVRTRSSNTKNFNSMYAQENYIRHAGSGIGNNAIGATYAIQVLSTGNITNTYNVQAVLNMQNAGNVTTAYGYHFTETKTSTGAATNIYAHYVENVANAATLNYAWYSNKGLNRFGDQLAVVGWQDINQLKITGFTTQTLPVGYLIDNTAATAVVRDVLQLETQSTGTAAAGLGVGLLFSLETATASTMHTGAQIAASWIDATNATRKAKLSLSAYDTAARLGIEIEASGTEAKLGFYGVATITRAILATGAGATVDNVITALQNLGLVKQA